MSTSNCLKCLENCSCVVDSELAYNGADILSTSTINPIINSNSLILKDKNSMNNVYFIRRESASSTQSNSGINSLNSSDSGEKNSHQLTENNIQAISENPGKFIKIISVSRDIGINQISNRTLNQFTIIKSNAINLNTNDINNKENSFNVIPIKVDRILPKHECTLDRLLTPTDLNEIEESDFKTKKRADLTFECSRCSEKYETLNQLNTHEVIHVFDSGIMKSTSSSSVGSEPITSTESSSEATPEFHRFSKRISGEKRKPDSRIKSELESQPKKAAFVCVECKKEFQRSQNHVVHMQKYHNQLPTVRERSKSKPKNNIELILSCEFCKKTLSSAKNLADHKAFHCIKSLDNIRKFCELQNIPTIGCSICGSTFETVENLKHHKSFEHIEFQMPIKNCVR